MIKYLNKQLDNLISILAKNAKRFHFVSSFVNIWSKEIKPDKLHLNFANIRSLTVCCSFIELIKWFEWAQKGFMESLLVNMDSEWLCWSFVPVFPKDKLLPANNDGLLPKRPALDTFLSVPL